MSTHYTLCSSFIASWSLECRQKAHSLLVLIVTVAKEEGVPIPPPLLHWMTIVDSVHFDECWLYRVGEVDPHTTPPSELSRKETNLGCSME